MWPLWHKIFFGAVNVFFFLVILITKTIFIYAFQMSILKQELETKSKTATDFEGKTKNLKSDLSSKSKQVKELEKEVNIFMFPSKIV